VPRSVWMIATPAYVGVAEVVLQIGGVLPLLALACRTGHSMGVAAAKGPIGLLGEISEGALDSTSDLPALLRKCVSLGGQVGSERLREWAALELKGYGSDDELPTYRLVAAPLVMDGIAGNNHIRGQTLPLTMIPEVAQGKLTTSVKFFEPIAEIEAMVQSARNDGENIIRLGPPGGEELVALINHKIATIEQDRMARMDMPPHQLVERIYWSVSIPPVTRILDVVRTTLVELVAEMTAGTPSGTILPTRDVAEQAVDVAIYGKGNRVNIIHAGDNSHVVAAASGGASLGAPVESKSRKVMWWIVGCVGIVGGIATVILLFR
jgi:AbiTii